MPHEEWGYGNKRPIVMILAYKTSAGKGRQKFVTFEIEMCALRMRIPAIKMLNKGFLQEETFVLSFIYADYLRRTACWKLDEIGQRCPIYLTNSSLSQLMCMDLNKKSWKESWEFVLPTIWILMGIGFKSSH